MPSPPHSAPLNLPNPPNLLLKHFSLLGLLGTLLFAGLLLVADRLDGLSHQATLAAREQGHLAVAQTRIREDLQTVRSDLHIITRLPVLHAYLDQGLPQQRTALIHLLRLWLHETGRYEQILCLDPQGSELLRVSGFDPPATPNLPPTATEAATQAAALRDTATLDAGAIRLTTDRTDPATARPLMRFSISITDQHGKPRGTLVFHYRAQRLLQDFHQSMNRMDGIDDSGQQSMLLNSDGHELIQAGSSSGLASQPASPSHFSSTFPAEWANIDLHAEGRLATANGLFFHSTLNPLEALTDTTSPPPAHPLVWKLVTRIPPELLIREALHRRPVVWLVLAVVYLFLLTATWFVLRARLERLRDRQALENNEARQEQLIRNLPVGVYLFRFHENGRMAFEYVSPVLCDILDINPADALHDPQTIFGTAQPDEKARLMTSLQQSAHTRQPFRWEGRFQVRQETRWIRISSDAVPDIDSGNLWSGVISDITERKTLEKELERQAHIDVLTGLNNRRHFFELAEHELSRARRHDLPLSALMLDIDHFKRCNDTWGHAVGDRVLQKLAEVCQHTLREIDIFGRIGGEEFTVLLVETNTYAALEAAERLRQALAAATVPLDHGQHLNFTVSIGVAYLTQEDHTIPDLLRRADMALYAAKNSGRNRVSDAAGGNHQREAL
ncbi:MAG: diguanylate cyclase [Sterolibacterium sp.]|nr:diguanylate cyclase [Sterolibacterium sp.]MBP9798994.1 diguanylate cyclase [Sterolibacterium sp.]